GIRVSLQEILVNIQRFTMLSIFFISLSQGLVSSYQIRLVLEGLQVPLNSRAVVLLLEIEITYFQVLFGFQGTEDLLLLLGVRFFFPFGCCGIAYQSGFRRTALRITAHGSYKNEHKSASSDFGFPNPQSAIRNPQSAIPHRRKLLKNHVGYKI